LIETSDQLNKTYFKQAADGKRLVRTSISQSKTLALHP